MNRKIALLCLALSAGLLIGLAGLLGNVPSNPGTVGSVGPNVWFQSAPLATDVGQGYTMSSGSVLTISTSGNGWCLSTGASNVTTSVPCKLVQLTQQNLTPIVITSSSAANGNGLVLSSTNTVASFPVSNVNQLFVHCVSATGAVVSYVYYQ